MFWKEFKYNGVTYDLSHLHPFVMNHIQPAKNDQPERHYLIEVIFSLHCFTRSKKGEENIDHNLLYSDSREERIFDFIRYECSKQLPQIIRELGKRKCYHTGHGNYFTVEIKHSNGITEEYDIFFKMARSKEKNRLTLFVQSAYLRDFRHKQNAFHSKKPINFNAIAYNTLTGKEIKTPK
jgi:hypothetical protein